MPFALFVKCGAYLKRIHFAKQQQRQQDLPPLRPARAPSAAVHSTHFLRPCSSTMSQVGLLFLDQFVSVFAHPLPARAQR